jgi:hypothetical protein
MIGINDIAREISNDIIVENVKRLWKN